MTEGEYQDPEFYVVMMMAGALDGLNANVDTPELGAETVQKAQILHAPGQLKVTSHVLGNSTITEDGRLIPPDDYILEHADVLAVELGLITELPDDLGKKMAGMEWFTHPPDYAPYLIEFFRGVTVDQRTNSITFPEHGSGIYEIKTPKTYIHLLPLALQEEFRKQRELNDQLREERVSLVALNPRRDYQAFQYMLANRLFLEAVKDPINVRNTYQIDVQSINQGISVTGVDSFFVVDPGYDCNTLPTDEDTSLSESRLKRMVNSSLLDLTTPIFRSTVLGSVATFNPLE